MALRPHSLKITNTLSRSKEVFVPLVEGHVGIYVCGPTVYSDTHLGHAKSYVSFDVIVRYLRHLGYRVRYVQNITDVGHLTDDADEGEDKMIRRAQLDRVHPMELAEKYTAAYLRDMDALKVRRADIYPRASQHIIEQIALIRVLIEKGHAYEVEGNVYFSVPSWPTYGVLSGRQTEEGESGHRITQRSDKRDPRDFALWKRADAGHILRWESPWGFGYPGWHIECSAMATKYLGETFDIHGGGLENQFPHHECEIAQSHACGHPFARIWLHNNMINVDGQKMGKSLGNFVTVQDALKNHTPETIRTFLLTTHYRTPANYTEEGLTAALGGVSRLQNALKLLRESMKNAGDSEQPGDASLLAAVDVVTTRFHEAMDDDFNTPNAIAALFDFVRESNSIRGTEALSAPAIKRAIDVYVDLGEGILGIAEGSAASGPVLDPFIELLLSVRQELKSARQFTLADSIRDRLIALRISVKDGKDGATWSRE
jgi:cysteinyl-tRNA synthetase